MGQFATQGGLSRALFRFAAAALGNFRGGLAMASVGRPARPSGRCAGRPIADRGDDRLGRAAGDEATRLLRAPRDRDRGRGRHAGILIPPSVILVVYAILTEQNIAKLFAAAFVPGIIAMIGYVVAIGST